MRTLSIASAAACAALAWGAPGAARADTVTLKNGHEIHGRLVEEQRDSIRIRTINGSITIAKSEVATFTENDNIGEDYARPVTGATRTPPSGSGDSEAPSSGEAPASGEAGAGGATAAGEWTWGPEVTDEQKEQLTPKRDALLEELEQLGAPAEERLAELKLTAQEEEVLGERIQAMSWRRRQGSANLRRQNAMERVIEEFGVKALPRLVESVQSENHWISRMSTQALVVLMTQAGEKAEQRKWLMYHFDAPSRLIELLDRQGEIDSPFLRQDANAALEAVTGTKQGYRPSSETLRTASETKAYKAWITWWKREKARWTKAQEQAKQRRAAISEELAAIREGRDPAEADPDEG